MTGEGMLRIVRKLLHPIAQLRLMHTKIMRGLRHRNPALPDQLDRFQLELARKLPSFHSPPPVPQKHLTRCLRNRQQLNPSFYPGRRSRRRTAILSPSADPQHNASNVKELTIISKSLVPTPRPLRHQAILKAHAVM
jgi:hypothetical protein